MAQGVVVVDGRPLPKLLPTFPKCSAVLKTVIRGHRRIFSMPNFFIARLDSSRNAMRPPSIRCNFKDGRTLQKAGLSGSEFYNESEIHKFLQNVKTMVIRRCLTELCGHPVYVLEISISFSNRKSPLKRPKSLDMAQGGYFSNFFRKLFHVIVHNLHITELHLEGN